MRVLDITYLKETTDGVGYTYGLGTRGSDTKSALLSSGYPLNSLRWSIVFDSDYTCFAVTDHKRLALPREFFYE